MELMDKLKDLSEKIPSRPRESLFLPMDSFISSTLIAMRPTKWTGNYSWSLIYSVSTTTSSPNSRC